MSDTMMKRLMGLIETGGYDYGKFKFDKRCYHKGVTYDIYRRKSRISIVLRCPHCGRRGTLVRSRKGKLFPKTEIKIHHDNVYCLFPQRDPQHGTLKEIIEKERGEIDMIFFECPICGQRFKTFHALVTHSTTHHDNGRCPICRKDYRNLGVHLKNQASNCDKHRVLYGLLARTKGSANRDNVIKARNYSYEQTQVEIKESE